MKNQSPVSIYIVTYLNSEERGRILKRTCEAALAQNYPNFEVVVSDNGGDYLAAAALESIHDSRLKVCTNEENAGFTGNINRCLKHCSHDIIKPICDDDLIHPDFLIHTVPLVDDETLVVVDIEKYLIGQDPEAIAHPIEDPLDVEKREAGYRNDIWSLPYAPCSIPSATLFTRELFQSLGGYDHKTITSDWDFFIEACLYRRISHLKKTLCYVGVWDGSLTEEMVEQPFFFPTEGLYTKLRVLHGKPLKRAERWHVRQYIFKEALIGGLRLSKNIGQGNYWSGYRAYLKKIRTFKQGSLPDLRRLG